MTVVIASIQVVINEKRSRRLSENMQEELKTHQSEQQLELLKLNPEI